MKKKCIKITKLYFIIPLLSLFLIPLKIAFAADPTQPGQLKLQVPIFGYVYADNIAQYTGQIYQTALFIIVPLAIVVIIFGGAQWILSAGNPSKIQGARKYIFSAFLGLFITLGSYLILSMYGLTTITTPDVMPIDTINVENAPLEPEIGNTPAPTGYKSSDINKAGCPSDSELQKIDMSKIKVTGGRADPRLRPNTLAKLYEGQEAAKKQSCTLMVSQAFRSYALQSYFYNCYITKSCNGGNAAARPSCNAPHMTGGAVDFGITCPGCTNAGCASKLKSILFSVGWTHWSGEWWHFEYGTAQWAKHPGADY